MPSLTCSGQIEAADIIDDRKPSVYRLLGVVFMGVRVAEIGENAVAHVFCDKATKALQNLGDAFVVFGDDLTQVLGIESR